MLSASVLAAPKKRVFTDRASAGALYEIQGEYLGEVEARGGKTGAQVVAVQDQFDLYLLAGGLPGEGWKRGDSRQKVMSSKDKGIPMFETEEWSATIEKGVLTLKDAKGGVLGSLKKVERKSPTLGAKPPEGALVLFDGSSAEHFDVGKNGGLTEDGLLGVPATCKKKLDNYTLHVEFRISFEPDGRGQGRGNSGVHVHGVYELQVLDTFGLEGAKDECGAFYNRRQPDVNMCYPPLSWQTYDVEFTGPVYDNDDGKVVKKARITAKQNGVVIHKDVELPAPPRKNKRYGYLRLQQHDSPVVYRNIWMVEKAQRLIQRF